MDDDDGKISDYGDIDEYSQSLQRSLTFITALKKEFETVMSYLKTLNTSTDDVEKYLRQYEDALIDLGQLSNLVSDAVRTVSISEPTDFLKNCVDREGRPDDPLRKLEQLTSKFGNGIDCLPTIRDFLSETKESMKNPDIEALCNATGGDEATEWIVQQAKAALEEERSANPSLLDERNMIPALIDNVVRIVKLNYTRDTLPHRFPDNEGFGGLQKIVANKIKKQIKEYVDSMNLMDSVVSKLDRFQESNDSLASYISEAGPELTGLLKEAKTELKRTRQSGETLTSGR